MPSIIEAFYTSWIEHFCFYVEEGKEAAQAHAIQSLSTRTLAIAEHKAPMQAILFLCATINQLLQKLNDQANSQGVAEPSLEKIYYLNIEYQLHLMVHTTFLRLQSLEKNNNPNISPLYAEALQAVYKNQCDHHLCCKKITDIYLKAHAQEKSFARQRFLLDKAKYYDQNASSILTDINNVFDDKMRKLIQLPDNNENLLPEINHSLENLNDIHTELKLYQEIEAQYYALRDEVSKLCGSISNDSTSLEKSLNEIKETIWEWMWTSESKALTVDWLSPKRANFFINRDLNKISELLAQIKHTDKVEEKQGMISLNNAGPAQHPQLLNEKEPSLDDQKALENFRHLGFTFLMAEQFDGGQKTLEALSPLADQAERYLKDFQSSEKNLLCLTTGALLTCKQDYQIFSLLINCIRLWELMLQHIDQAQESKKFSIYEGTLHNLLKKLKPPMGFPQVASMVVFYTQQLEARLPQAALYFRMRNSCRFFLLYAGIASSLQWVSTSSDEKDKAGKLCLLLEEMNQQYIKRYLDFKNNPPGYDNFIKDTAKAPTDNALIEKMIFVTSALTTRAEFIAHDSLNDAEIGGRLAELLYWKISFDQELYQRFIAYKELELARAFIRFAFVQNLTLSRLVATLDQNNPQTNRYRASIQETNEHLTANAKQLGVSLDEQHALHEIERIFLEPSLLDLKLRLTLLARSNRLGMMIYQMANKFLINQMSPSTEKKGDQEALLESKDVSDALHPHFDLNNNQAEDKKAQKKHKTRNKNKRNKVPPSKAPTDSIAEIQPKPSLPPESPRPKATIVTPQNDPDIILQPLASKPVLAPTPTLVVKPLITKQPPPKPKPAVQKSAYEYLKTEQKVSQPKKKTVTNLAPKPAGPSVIFSKNLAKKPETQALTMVKNHPVQKPVKLVPLALSTAIDDKAKPVISVIRPEIRVTNSLGVSQQATEITASETPARSPSPVHVKQETPPSVSGIADFVQGNINDNTNWTGSSNPLVNLTPTETAGGSQAYEHNENNDVIEYDSYHHPNPALPALIKPQFDPHPYDLSYGNPYPLVNNLWGQNHSAYPQPLSQLPIYFNPPMLSPMFSPMLSLQQYTSYMAQQAMAQQVAMQQMAALQHTDLLAEAYLFKQQQMEQQLFALKIECQRLRSQAGEVASSLNYSAASYSNHANLYGYQNYGYQQTTQTDQTTHKNRKYVKKH